jgi:hypothetical protein
MKNRWVGAALWGSAVVLAVGAGTGAVAAASTGSGRPVLSQDQVARDLRGLPATPGASAAPRPAVPGPQVDGAQPLTVSAGTVAVSCSGDIATLLRWTPKTGFRADDPIIGPAAFVSVRFESDAKDNDGNDTGDNDAVDNDATGDNDVDVTVTVHCDDGTAVASTTIGDDHGGNDNGGGPTPNATGDDHGGNNGGGDGGDGSGKGKGGGHGKNDH